MEALKFEILEFLYYRSDVFPLSRYDVLSEFQSRRYNVNLVSKYLDELVKEKLIISSNGKTELSISPDKGIPAYESEKKERFRSSTDISMQNKNLKYAKIASYASVAAAVISVLAFLLQLISALSPP